MFAQIKEPKECNHMANFSLLVILIEKEITEMKLDIDHVMRYVFLNYI